MSQDACPRTKTENRGIKTPYSLLWEKLSKQWVPLNLHGFQIFRAFFPYFSFQFFSAFSTAYCGLLIGRVEIYDWPLSKYIGLEARRAIPIIQAIEVHQQLHIMSKELLQHLLLLEVIQRCLAVYLPYCCHCSCLWMFVFSGQGGGGEGWRSCEHIFATFSVLQPTCITRE